ncbi:MAG: TetR/AcrR family transcriptional regulator [Bacillota bacterium]
MPKQTFFNLSEEKRNAIIETSIEEFSANSYKNASITKIAERSNIAKGSVYQYFHNKKDLYKYIIDLAGAKKAEYLMDFAANIPNLSFFELIRELYIRGLKFARENPKYSALANNFLKENDIKFKEEILGVNLEKSNQFFEDLIENGKRKGDISSRVDTKVGAYIITHLNTAIVDYLLSYMQYNDILKDEGELIDKVDKMLIILEHGFKRREGGE